MRTTTIAATRQQGDQQEAGEFLAEAHVGRERGEAEAGGQAGDRREPAGTARGGAAAPARGGALRRRGAGRHDGVAGRAGAVAPDAGAAGVAAGPADFAGASGVAERWAPKLLPPPRRFASTSAVARKAVAARAASAREAMRFTGNSVSVRGGRPRRFWCSGD